MSSADPSSAIYDIIFVGGTASFLYEFAIVLTIRSGGAAACITAGRLAQADPSLNILVSVKESLVYLIQPNYSDRGSWSTYS